MNKTVIFAIVLFVLSAGTATAQSDGPIRIGIFDATRISEETDEGKRVQTDLTRFRDAKQAEITAKEKDVADLQNQLNTQALSLSPDKRAALEKDIQRKVLDLNQARETATREMQLEVAEAQSRFQEQLLAVVERFGQDEGFTLILEKGLVAYSSAAVDVTTALVDRFNRLVPSRAEPAEAAAPGESGD